MTSTIRVGQSPFVTQPIDEDSQERILNCLKTLSEVKVKQEEEQDEVGQEVREVFLKDTKAAYAKMVAVEEVSLPLHFSRVWRYIFSLEKGSRKP